MPQGKNRTTTPLIIGGPNSSSLTTRSRLGDNHGRVQANPESLTSREVGRTRLPAHKQGPRNPVGGPGKVATRSEHNPIRIPSKKGKNVKGQVSEKRASAGARRGEHPTKNREGQRRMRESPWVSRVKKTDRVMRKEYKRERKITGKNPRKREPR